MGLFYVWFKYHIPGCTVSQRLLAFVNREAADEWWRIISTPPSGFVGRVRRMSPQLYVQNAGDDVYYFFRNDTESPDKNHFSERIISACCIYDNETNPTAILPQSEVTDHISGQWYFVRSKVDPSSLWYLRTSGTCAVCGRADCDAVHASSDYRTLFCVQVRSHPQVPKDFVMIGRDEISIAAPKGHVLFINDAGDLKATKEYRDEPNLIFGDLENRFIARAERQVNGEVWEYIESVERGVGEVWELVK